MDKEYWEKYYSTQGPSEQPSDFARFCRQKYKQDHGILFDIGCGNGRDTLYFASQNIPTVGIDQSETVIQNNRNKCKNLGLDAAFHIGDFSACNYDDLTTQTYSIYSRFTLHAINYKEEDRLFEHIKSVKNLSYLFLEARSIKDKLYGQGKQVGEHEFVTSHYRRFIDPENLKLKLKNDFEIEYFDEACGYARTETEDPCVIRMIAKRSGRAVYGNC